MQEAAIVAARLIAYDQQRHDNDIVLVADRNDGFNFEQTSDALARLFGPIVSVRRSCCCSLCDTAARSQWLNALTRGTRIVNYARHG